MNEKRYLSGTEKTGDDSGRNAFIESCEWSGTGFVKIVIWGGDDAPGVSGMAFVEITGIGFLGKERVEVSKELEAGLERLVEGFGWCSWH